MLGGWGHGQETGRGRGEASMGLPRTAAPRPAPCSLACGPQRPSLALGPPPTPSSESPVWGTETKPNSAPLWGLSWGGGLQGPRLGNLQGSGAASGSSSGRWALVVGQSGNLHPRGTLLQRDSPRLGSKSPRAAPSASRIFCPNGPRHLPPLWWLRVSSGPHCICHMSSTHPLSGV